MKINSKPFTQINREHIITSAELRRFLDLKGEILSIGLYRGRSLIDEEAGVSPEKDEWYVNTREVKVLKDGGKRK